MSKKDFTMNELDERRDHLNLSRRRKTKKNKVHQASELKPKTKALNKTTGNFLTLVQPSF